MPNGPWSSLATPAAATASFTDLVGGASPTWGSITGPVSAATALYAVFAPLASPTFTGTVSGITASMVGALASGGTAADSSKLGGQLPAYYYQASNPSGFQTAAQVTAALTWGSISGASAQAAPAGGWTGNHGAFAVGALTATSGTFSTDLLLTKAISSSTYSEIRAQYQSGPNCQSAVRFNNPFNGYGGQVSIWTQPETNGAAMVQRMVIDPSGAASFQGNAVSMGALTATSGTFSSYLRAKSSGAGYAQLYTGTSANPNLELYDGTNDAFLELSSGNLKLSNNGSGLTISTTGAATFSSSVSTGNGTVYTNSLSGVVLGNVNDSTSGWGACGIGFGAASGQHSAFGHAGTTLYFGIENGTAGTMGTWLSVAGATKAATFASSVSMGALTATTGTFSGNIGTAAGCGLIWNGDANRIMTPEDNVYGALIKSAGGFRVYGGGGGGTHFINAPGTGIVDLVQSGATVAGSLILTLGNVGTNAATLQAAVASATAPKVGTYAQMIAWTVAAGTTPYWYATDVTETDGLLGKLYQWSGSAWVAVGTPQTVVGRVIAGVISAGAVGAQAIAADVALIGQVLRSTGFTAGSSSVAPSGFKFSGTAFTASLLDGTTISAFGEIGGDVSIGGSKAAVIANRVKGNLFFRNTVGTTDVFIPDGIVSIEVTLQATGGAGAASYGTGGGGGQYIKAQVTVKPHNTYRLTLGASGSVSSFTWVSFDGASGFTTDSSAVNFSAAAGAAGTAGSGSGAAGADVGFSFPGPESSWNITGSAAGDGLPAGAIAQAGRGGNIYGLGSGGNGGGTTGTKAGGGGGGASATGNGGVGGIQPANGSAGTSGGGGGGGAAGGAGGVGFVRAKW